MVLIREFLKRMNDSGVRYVLIGGVAGTVHGSPLITEDIDLCAPLDQDNLARILAALKGLNPRFRMRPDKLPVPDDPARLAGFRNLNLLTDLGIIDILSEVTGLGNYEVVLEQTEPKEIEGLLCSVLTLNALIVAKRAAGRRKDLRAVEELEALRRRIDERNAR